MHVWRSLFTPALTLFLLMTPLLVPLGASAHEGHDIDLSELHVENASTVQQDDADATPATGDEELTGYLVGDPDAPVTLQIYADYQCPHCHAFYETIEPQLLEDYVLTGKVRIEYLDFTIVGVPSLGAMPDDELESVQAAEAAMCAAEQDAWLEYNHAVFDLEFEPNSGALSNDNLIGIAEELELDVDRFGECLESGTYEEAVIAYVNLAVERKVEATPSLSINGGAPFFVPESGYEGIQEMLDEAIGS